MKRINLFNISISAVLVLGVLGCNDANTTSETSKKTNDIAPIEAKKSADSDSNPAESAQLASTNNTRGIEAAITRTIHEHLGQVPISKITKSKLSGFYEVFTQGQMIYISDDRQYLFPGPLLSIVDNKLQNLTQVSLAEIDKEKAPERAKLMSNIPEAEMVVFKSEKEKYVVNVFTDVDCPYCRRLHQKVPEYNDLGITIRYLAFPRAGVGSGAYDKLVSIWCAEDKSLAMDNAKLHNKFDDNKCENPVANQYSMTRDLGLSGTPALILGNGMIISGFVEPKQLLERLEANNS